MADAKISALPSATVPLAGTEVLPIVQSGTTDKVTAADLLRQNGQTVTANNPVLSLAQTWNNAGVSFTAALIDVTSTAAASGSYLLHLRTGGSDRHRFYPNGDYIASGSLIVQGSSISTAGALQTYSATAIPAGGTAGVGLKVSSTANFGVFFGSGAPTLAAAKGSLYLRSDGSGINDRMYVNTDGSTAWAAVVTAS